MITFVLFVLMALGGREGGPALETLRDAEAAYEKGSYESCLARLVQVERTAGRNPRVESLRALALAELGKTAEAYRSIRIYLALTAGHDRSRSPAHAELVRRGEELRAKLEAERRKLQEARAKLKDEGTAEVDAVESTVRRQVDDKIRARERNFQAFEQAAWRRTLHLNAAAARRAHEGQRAAAAAAVTTPPGAPGP